MTTHYHHMPVDKTKIKTRLRISPGLLTNPVAYIREHALPVRTVKSSRGTSRHGPTRNLTLDVLTYKGIKVKLRKVTGYPLTDATIDFNPGACLYGHNGRILNLTAFLYALGTLATLTPLLRDHEDWVDLIPGLRSGGVAYWSYLEVPFHCTDPDGTLLSGFRHAHRPRTQVRHWEQSIEIGGKRSELRMAIYRKAVEMVAHGKLPKHRLDEYWHILRFEARLKGKKLVQHLGNERNIEKIDGEDRLVRFYARDLVGEHRAIFSKLVGVYSSNEPLREVSPKSQLIPLGRLLARVALDPRTPKTFPELLAVISSYTGASSATIGQIRKAGMAALSSQSSISMDDLFSDAAYIRKFSISNEELETKVSHEIDCPHPLIYKAYRPPDQPYQPNTEWPSYLKP